VNKKIENAIREIRESQADKGRTSSVRKDLEQLRHEIKNGKKSENDDVEQRIENVTKIARKHGVAAPQTEGDNEPKPLEKGDMVRIQGQDSIGQIIEISKKTAAVAFGDFITTVSPSKLEFISKNKARKQLRTSRPTSMTNDFSRKRMTFKPYIDVRGKYADEAIQIIGEFVDNAIMFESNELRILHGRGNGILRQVIRDYLRTIRQVTDIADEHIDHGGDGITVVRLG
jgi:DNA mismatch repair protein MutS2